MGKSVPHLILYSYILYLRFLEHRKESFDQIYLNQFEKYWKEFAADTVARPAHMQPTLLPCHASWKRPVAAGCLPPCRYSRCHTVRTRGSRAPPQPGFLRYKNLWGAIFLLLFSLTQVLATAIGAAPMSHQYNPLCWSPSSMQQPIGCTLVTCASRDHRVHQVGRSCADSKFSPSPVPPCHSW
jgi:hypothetical protein